MTPVRARLRRRVDDEVAFERREPASPASSIGLDAAVTGTCRDAARALGWRATSKPAGP